MKQRRVVVTGLGLISPVGSTVADGWAALVAGRRRSCKRVPLNSRIAEQVSIGSRTLDKAVANWIRRSSSSPDPSPGS